jgi:hypothetical protein
MAEFLARRIVQGKLALAEVQQKRPDLYDEVVRIYNEMT